MNIYDLDQNLDQILTIIRTISYLVTRLIKFQNVPQNTDNKSIKSIHMRSNIFGKPRTWYRWFPVLRTLICLLIFFQRKCCSVTKTRVDVIIDDDNCNDSKDNLLTIDT